MDAEPGVPHARMRTAAVTREGGSDGDSGGAGGDIVGDVDDDVDGEGDGGGDGVGADVHDGVMTVVRVTDKDLRSAVTEALGSVLVVRFS